MYYTNNIHVTRDNNIVIKGGYSYAKYFSSFNVDYSNYYPSNYSPYSFYYSSVTDGFYISSIATNTYLSNTYDSNYGYYVLNYYTNNSFSTTIFTISSGSLPNFKISPDGRYIGIIYVNSGYYKLYIYDLSTNNKYVVADFGYDQISDFQFSKDGQKIVISGNSSYSSVNDLFVISSDGTGSLTNITNTSSIDEVNPDWK